MQNQSTIAALILAAGSSSRMGEGRHKLLLPLSGRPVLTHVIEATLASQARPIVLVLGHRAEEVREQIAPFTDLSFLTLVENPAYTQGMSTSLQAGIRPLLTHPEIGGALVLLGDQPLMICSVLDRLIAAWRERQSAIVAPLYEGQRGNPVLFAASLFPELLETTGDEGGRSVVQRHRQQMSTLEIGDTITASDVDTWDAYQQVQAAWKLRQPPTE